jgi:hypothetical protein
MAKTLRARTRAGWVTKPEADIPENRLSAEEVDDNFLALEDALSLKSSAADHIGPQGGQGFGVGICSTALSDGLVPLSGYTDPGSDNHGNYLYSDGSVMCRIPAFYYRIGHIDNPTYTNHTVNSVHILPYSAFADVAAANAAGRAMVFTGQRHFRH